MDRKLVRFDCQIVDMFEEELYIPVVPKKNLSDPATSRESDNPLIYKYFSEMSDEQVATY